MAVRKGKRTGEKPDAINERKESGRRRSLEQKKPKKGKPLGSQPRDVKTPKKKKTKFS